MSDIEMGDLRLDDSVWSNVDSKEEIIIVARKQ